MKNVKSTGCNEPIAQSDVYEGHYAKKEPNQAFGHRSSVGKTRKGRKRRGRSMGRYPFITYSLRYIEEYKPYLAETTLKEQERKLRYISRTFQQLKQDGRIDTTSPRKIGEKEIREYMMWMREQGIETNGQVKYLQILNNLLR